MNTQRVIVVSAALRTTVSSARRAWLPVLSYASAIVAVQFLTSPCAVAFALTRAFNSSDGYCVIASLLAEAWLGVGLYKICLNATRQEPFRMSSLFAGPGLVVRFYVLVLVIALIGILVGLGPLLLALPVAYFVRAHLSQELILVGGVLLLLPGAVLFGYLVLMFSQVPWLLLDDRARHFDSLRQSKHLTKGFLWKLGIAYSVLTLPYLPISGVYQLALMLPDMFPSNLIQPILFLSLFCEVLFLAFMAFTGAALYQQLLDGHHQVHAHP